jgi:transcriptional regulator with XRE-family HTH domain
MDNGKLGKFLAELRKEKGLTQEKLAELIDCDNRTISKWETGVYTPPIQYLTKLSDLYNISIAEIMQCERNKSYSKDHKNKDENFLKNINKYNQITKRKIIINFLLILLITIISFSISIISIKIKEWHVLSLTNDNEKYYVEGNIIYNNETIIYNIKELQFNSEYIGTTLEPKIKYLEVSLYYDNNLIMTKTDEYSELTLIHIAFQNIYFSEQSENKYSKNKDLKLLITYFDNENKKETEIILLKTK